MGSSDRANVKLKSLLQSSENKKNCKDRVLELILDWQEDLDQAQYPNFRATFVELKRGPHSIKSLRRESVFENNKSLRRRIGAFLRNRSRKQWSTTMSPLWTTRGPKSIYHLV